MLVGIMGVVYYHRPAKAIAVLGHKVTVVPERPCIPFSFIIPDDNDPAGMLTCLVRDVKVVQERMVLHDGTLRDGGDSVSPIGPVLEQTMPMLRVAKTRIRAKLHSK